jgi:hypothetical protein
MTALLHDEALADPVAEESKCHPDQDVLGVGFALDGEIIDGETNISGVE